ncbi:MAG: hypothetical protein CL610_03360 [Anaerolineaceae bacterium]|nr:hypothetical protein [Anaerolineaceae bacterium]
MGETSNPLNRRRLTRAAIIGGGMGLGGVLAFLLLWVGLGSAGVDQFPRLIMSVCLPPALIALIFGVYFLFFQPKKPD